MLAKKLRAHAIGLSQQRINTDGTSTFFHVLNCSFVDYEIESIGLHRNVFFSDSAIDGGGGFARHGNLLQVIFSLPEETCILDIRKILFHKLVIYTTETD